MRNISLTALLVTLFTCAFAQSPVQKVNSIIGDESYVQTFGTLPEATTDEQLRIQTHLAYVEKKLREKDPSLLNEDQIRKRNLVLDLLHRYWTNGVFPTNYDYTQERRPCFIDRDGKICAVGYLIAQTAGMPTAIRINEEHQYDYLLDMHEEVIENWAEEFGLTLEECAMIQPGYMPFPYPYQPQVTEVPLKKEYGISSSALGGINLAVNILNLSSRNFPGKGTVSGLGFVTGSAQLLLGLTNIKKDIVEQRFSGGDRITSYKARNNLSYINIAAGTTTIFTSALNLYLNSRIKDKRNAVSLYSLPGMYNEMNMGLCFSRRL